MLRYAFWILVEGRVFCIDWVVEENVEKLEMNESSFDQRKSFDKSSDLVERMKK